MSWARLDDRFWMHPVIVAIGNEGAGVFARMLSYCGGYRTNGLVPAPVVASIVGEKEEVLKRLHELGSIDMLESGSVQIRNYLEYNPSRDEIDNQREQAKERAKKSRDRKARA